MPPLTLADLSRLGTARIRRVLLEGTAGDRLRELGFAPGTLVSFVRAAPLGDPLCFRLRGTELCLRRGEASAVEIEADLASAAEQAPETPS